MGRREAGMVRPATRDRRQAGWFDTRIKVWGSFFPDKLTGASKIDCDELAQRLQEKEVSNPLVDVLAAGTRCKG